MPRKSVIQLLLLSFFQSYVVWCLHSGAGADTGGVQKRYIDIPIKATSNIIGSAAPKGAAHDH